MAFKKGVTFYFTDEGKYEEFLENHKNSGTTKSKFVLKHLEGNRSIFDKKNNKFELTGGFYNSYPYTQFVDASFSFDEVFFLGGVTDSNLKKRLLENIDEKIKDHFLERILIDNAELLNRFYHLIKTKIKVMYMREKKDGVDYINASCFCRYGFIEINESLWKKYDGLYDFTSITYKKFFDVFSKPNKNNGLAMLLEREKTGDAVGGFFISVHSGGKSYPKDPSKSGFQVYPERRFLWLKVSGLNGHQNINRVSFEEHKRIDNGKISLIEKTRIK
ncbi:hypothetical protein RJ498_003057 [Pluralibacter gergoviae]